MRVRRSIYLIRSQWAHHSFLTTSSTVTDKLHVSGIRIWLHAPHHAYSLTQVDVRGIPATIIGGDEIRKQSQCQRQRWLVSRTKGGGLSAISAVLSTHWRIKKRHVRIMFYRFASLPSVSYEQKMTSLAQPQSKLVALHTVFPKCICTHCIRDSRCSLAVTTGLSIFIQQLYSSARDHPHTICKNSELRVLESKIKYISNFCTSLQIRRFFFLPSYGRCV